jgi:hypothetical protein
MRADRPPSGRTCRPVRARGNPLYEAASGHPPFSATDALTLIHQHRTALPPAPSGVGPALAAIILRLLEKDPQQRYQSADGLGYDLALAAAGTAPAALGRRDFPLRLKGPRRPTGRADESAQLADALAQAVQGKQRGVLIRGPAGVGKSLLAAQLEARVAVRGGRYISGSCDQHLRERENAGMHRALRSLGRLLLAEPPAVLACQRTGLLETLGANAGLIAAMVPELAVLLDCALELPDTGADGMAERLFQAGLDLLRAVVSPHCRRCW